MESKDETLESKDETLEMKCSLDKDGIVTCNISKENFNDLQQKNITAKKLVFQLD